MGEWARTREREEERERARERERERERKRETETERERETEMERPETTEYVGERAGQTYTSTRTRTHREIEGKENDGVQRRPENLWSLKINKVSVERLSLPLCVFVYLSHSPSPISLPLSLCLSLMFLSQLPLDPRDAKALFLNTILGVRDQGAYIAAIRSVGGVYDLGTCVRVRVRVRVRVCVVYDVGTCVRVRVRVRVRVCVSVHLFPRCLPVSV